MAELLSTTEVLTSHPQDISSTVELFDDYDFIIIGGGTAGLVVAARLTEDPNVRVLVLEAGTNRRDDPKILTPGLAFSMCGDPTYDWCFQTPPQKELNGRIVPHPRGKLLGGSSAINQTMTVHTSKCAFDAWEKMGNPNWNWDTMLPYLRKFHTQHEAPAKFKEEFLSICHEDEALKSNEGPIQFHYSNGSDGDKAWYEAWQKIMSGKNYEGFGAGGFLTSSAIDPKTKTRSYAGSAYYSADIAARPNLRVITEALVEKIILEKGTEAVARGVQFVSKTGERMSINAEKEVILSAGAVQSPQILELSGVGNPELLMQHGIDVVVDNPNVGENLQDHGMVFLSFEVNDGVQTADPILRDPSISQQLIAMYQKDRSGPMGQHFMSSAHLSLPETFGPNANTFHAELLRSVTRNGPNTPHDKLKESVLLDLFSQPDGATMHYFLTKFQVDTSTGSTITEMFKPKHEGNYFAIGSSLNHPFSRGHIHVTSSDPTQKPEFDPKYLSHPMDLELWARHVQFYSVLLSTPPLSEYFKTGGRRTPINAFANGNEPPSLEEAKEIVRSNMISMFHPAGTCALGKRETGGVLNERLKVYGVKNLRVVDASVFPLMPRGNIVTSVYAVAERAADLIKEDWKGH